MIIIYIVYFAVLVIAFLFLLFFLYVVITYKRKDTIPIVYIYLMIISNIIGTLVEMFHDIFPVFLSVEGYDWLRKHAGPYSTLLDDFSYAFPMFLTIVMVTERFYVIFSPFGHAFSNGKLWIYCLTLALFTFIFCITPLLSGCPLNYDFKTFNYLADCDNIFTYIFDKYNGFIPLICMFLNIGLILYLKYKRRKIHNSNDPVSVARRSHEKTMFIQSVLSTTFLLTYEITESIIEFSSENYMKLSETTRRSIYYCRNSTVALRCFFIYFIGTPAIRKIILEKTKQMARIKKKGMNTVMIGGSRDQSAVSRF